MRAAVYKGKRLIKIEEMETPVPANNEALIHISHAGICGTDLHIYNGNYRTAPPMIIGHELSGEIAEVNASQDKKLAVGDRVVVRPTIYCHSCHACKVGFPHVCANLRMIGIDTHGAFAEFIKVPLNMIYPIPQGVSLKQAALVEPLAVAVHAVRNATLLTGDDVVVIGAGSIGMLIGLVAKYAGAGAVYITDVNNFRLRKAKSLGLTAVNNGEIDFKEYIREKTAGKMADVTFEAAGVPATAKMLTEVTSIRGRMVVVAAFRQDPEVSLISVTFKEQQMIGTRVYTDEDYKRALNLLKDHPEVEEVATRVLPLDEITEGIEAVKNGEDVIKVLIDVRR